VIAAGERDLDGQPLKVKAAHLRLEDEAAVLVPVKPEFNQLPSSTRLQIIDELGAASRAERLQGEVIAVWALPDGIHLGFLAEPRWHPRMKTVTQPRVQANLNRTLRVASPSAELTEILASPDDLQPGGGTSPRAATRRFRPEGDGAAGAPSPAVATGDVSFADDPFAAVGTPTLSLLQTPSGRFARDAATGSARPAPAAAVALTRSLAPTAGTSPGTVPGTVPSTSPAAMAAAVMAGAAMAADARPLGSIPAGAPVTSPPEHRPPANERLLRLVTMVFTDIVGSTEMKQRLGEHRAMELIQWHHTIVREVLSLSQTGEEVSTAGDSFFLVFSAPSDAVRFALRLQARLRTGPGMGFVIHDRIGIHVGEVFMTTEAVAGKVRDYYGMQVDTCARVMSLGGADQILMTRFAADNARQTLRNYPIPGLNPPHWVCHGYYTLKGVDEPVEVFEIGEKGLAKMQTPSPDKRLHY
jgi:class 3 adenylate cyclase